MVQIVESTLVAPAGETPKHRLWLSGLDVAAARGHTPLLFCFCRSSMTTSAPPDAARTLKSALAKALVPYYPLAGRLATDPAGRVEIDCSGEGARFVVARSESEFDDLGDLSPSPEMRKAFVPAAESADPPCILLMIQVTFLRCGGVVLGIGVHHAAVDGRIMFRFVGTWASIARAGDSGPAAVLPPVVDRTVLRARSPPTVLRRNSEYSRTPFAGPGTSAAVAAAALKLSERQLSLLKSRCGGTAAPGNCTSFSTFQVVAAHVWRCACRARRLAPDEEATLAMAIDVRSRLRPPLPAHYLGNAVMRVPVAATVAEILSYSIEFGAEKIRSAIETVDDESVRSVIDYVESAAADAESLSSRSGLPRTKLCIVSWLGMPVYDADFGWGKPAVMTRAQFYGSGFVYLISDGSDAGGVNVVVSLEPESIVEFKRLFYEQLISSSI